MNIFKAFGLKKARELPPEFGEGKKLVPSEPDKASIPYITTRDDLRHHIDRQGAERSRKDRDAAATTTEPGEGERIHGRTPTDVRDKDKKQNRWNVIGGKKSQTLADTREGRTDVGGTRARQFEGEGGSWANRGIGGAYRKPESAVQRMRKAFGLKKEHGKIAGGPDDPDYGNNPGETYAQYQARFPKTDFGTPEPHVYPPGSGKREPITTDDDSNDASQGGLWDDPTEPGEGVPIHGTSREKTAKQKSEELHQKVERPQSHHSKATTLANLREGQTPRGSRGRARIGVSPEAQSSAGGSYRRQKSNDFAASIQRMFGFK